MNKEQLTEMVIEKVTAIAFKEVLHRRVSLSDRFRADLAFDSLDSFELTLVLVKEIAKHSDDQLVADDFDVFWMDYDATVQDMVNYIAEKLDIVE